MNDKITIENDKKVKKIIRKRKIMRIFTIFFIFILIIYAVGGTFAGIYVSKQLEGEVKLSPEDLVSNESTKIYDANGRLISEIGQYYRENISYQDCPEALVDAFLSIEDSRFFTHNGFDIPRFISSVINTFVYKDMQGGSTFTMQLIKNTYFTVDDINGGTERQATIQYKLQQIDLAMKLEKQVSKQQVFELYVNKLNFGGRIRGVEKAAKYYFGKTTKELNLSECALLAGIVNLPNTYNPYAYLDYATTRRNEVLYQMYNHGYITPEEYRLAKSIRVEDLLVGTENFITTDTAYPEYLDVVIEEAMELTGKDPSACGMQIYTALNQEMQTTIQGIENGAYNIPYTDELMQTCMITMDNTNGEIIAIGGGRNYGSEGGALLLNRATKQFKQPGSTVKGVIDYPLAFEYLGYSTDEILLDKPITFPCESRVLVNADGSYKGDITIKEALQRSLNIPAILTAKRVVNKIGSEAFVDYMHSLGFTKVSTENFHLSYAIGGNDFTTTAKELAGAYGAMINLGVYNEPHTIRKILTKDQIYLPKNQKQRVLSSGSAYLMDSLLAQNCNNEVYNYMQILRRNYPVYCKTGTTDWGEDGVQYGIPKGAMKDKWMVSNTSRFTNVVWVGYDMAVKDKGTYFPTWKAALNIPGKINKLLLDAEEVYASDEQLAGVQKPYDVREETYVRGTYPHVSGTNKGQQITSMVSSTGYSNVPTQNYNEIYQGTPVLDIFDVSLSNNILYVNFNQQDSCGGSRDISLKDQWNDIKQSGACLVSTDYLFTSGNKYYISVYQNDTYYGTFETTNSESVWWGGNFEGDVKVCGTLKNRNGASNTACKYAGYRNDNE